MSGEPYPPNTSGARGLRRDLTLRDLVLFGIVIISPVAPMGIFGVLNERGQGHAATMILISLVPMLFTAISYGLMARAYPSAGSAFAYVSQELHPVLGYVIGWSMVMDYLMAPLINIIWCSQQVHVFLPGVPYWAWALAFASILTTLNIQGIKASARYNFVLASALAGVVVIFLIAAAIYVVNHPPTEDMAFSRPFYDPETWAWSGILSGTSLAMMTYLGFDAISTLSEEARDPKRHILPATILTCLIIGLISTVEVYAAQLIWPASERYPNAETAFTFVAQRAWAPLLGILGVTLIVAYAGCSLGFQLGAARLLYAMGRSGALPSSVFATLEHKRHVPRNNVILVGVFALLGALLLPHIASEVSAFVLAANLVNFGALIAFMGVNAAACAHFWRRGGRNAVFILLASASGFVVCALLWWNLSAQAKSLGASWLALGLALVAWKTRGFRRSLSHAWSLETAKRGE